MNQKDDIRKLQYIKELNTSNTNYKEVRITMYHVGGLKKKFFVLVDGEYHAINPRFVPGYDSEKGVHYIFECMTTPDCEKAVLYENIPQPEQSKPIMQVKTDVYERVAMKKLQVEPVEEEPEAVIQYNPVVVVPRTKSSKPTYLCMNVEWSSDEGYVVAGEIHKSPFQAAGNFLQY